MKKAYKKSITLLLALSVATFLLTAGPAAAVQYSFYNISNNSAVDALIGEQQLFMDVTSPVGNQVAFTFSNIGLSASSITDIYFEDPLPLLLYTSPVLTSSLGVSFSAGASPPNLPSGNTVNFVATASYDSTSPAQPNGINPNEWLTILLSIAPTYDFNDVIAALDDATLRVGIHVQGFTGGGSESFVNEPNNPVPEPGTIILLGSGFLGLAIYAKRRRNS